MSENIQVMIVDDEPLIMYSLTRIINREPGMTVLHTAGDGQRALEALTNVQPDLLLMDIQMPGMNGLQCLREISRLHPELPVIILTTFDEEPYIIDGLANGARSYLIKSADFQGLTTHIRDVFANKFVLPANIAAKLAHYLHEKKSNDQKSIAPLLFEQYSFTPMEKNIIHLLAERRTNKEIADRLFISVGTVKNHLISIFEKLEVKTRFESFAGFYYSLFC